MNEQLSGEVKKVKAQLANNDDQNLIDNLERRWTNNQQNNQVQSSTRISNTRIRNNYSYKQ